MVDAEKVEATSTQLKRLGACAEGNSADVIPMAPCLTGLAESRVAGRGHLNGSLGIDPTRVEVQPSKVLVIAPQLEAVARRALRTKVARDDLSVALQVLEERHARRHQFRDDF